MLIDCTEMVVRIDPESYPKGLVVRVLDAPDVEAWVECDSRILEPRTKESWVGPGGACELRDFSLTEHEFQTDLEQDGYTDFLVRSSFILPDSQWPSREIPIGVVHRADGWRVELSVTETTIAYPLSSEFHPRYCISDEGKIVQESGETGDNPTLWDHLNEEG